MIELLILIYINNYVDGVLGKKNRDGFLGLLLFSIVLLFAYVGYLINPHFSFTPGVVVGACLVAFLVNSIEHNPFTCPYCNISVSLSQVRSNPHLVQCKKCSNYLILVDNRLRPIKSKQSK
jgi:hypothetical protein